MKSPFPLSFILIIILAACAPQKDPQNQSVDEDPAPSTQVDVAPDLDKDPEPQPELKTLTDLEFRDGKYYEKGGDEPITGKFQAHHKNGELMSESHYVNGLKDGVEKGWDPYGKLRLETNFKNGKNHGMARNWHPNGQLMNETNFVNGLTHGLSKTWHNNGERSTETHYNYGKIEGYSRSWHTNGKKRSEVQYRNGRRHGMVYQWDQEESLIRQERYIDGEHVETLVEPPVVEEPLTENPATAPADIISPEATEIPEPPKDVVEFIAKGHVKVVAREATTGKVILSKSFEEGDTYSLKVNGKINLLLQQGDNLTLVKGDYKTDAGGGSGVSNLQMALAEDGSIILTEQ